MEQNCKSSHILIKSWIDSFLVGWFLGLELFFLDAAVSLHIWLTFIGSGFLFHTNKKSSIQWLTFICTSDRYQNQFNIEFSRFHFYVLSMSWKRIAHKKNFVFQAIFSILLIVWTQFSQRKDFTVLRILDRIWSDYEQVKITRLRLRNM